MIKSLPVPRSPLARSIRRRLTRALAFLKNRVFPRRVLARAGLPVLVAGLTLMAGFFALRTTVEMRGVMVERREQSAARRLATRQAEQTAAALPTPRPSRTPTPAAGRAGQQPAAATRAPSIVKRVAMLLAGPTPTPTPTPEAKTQRAAPVDGQTAVYIPGGTFNMGRPRRSGQAAGSEQPVHPVTLTGFWMGRTPVTNAMYAVCVEAGGCTNPIRKKINPHYYDPKFADHPVVYVVWQQAGDYCAWAGGRLPTEAEWERAARGNRKVVVFAWGESDPRPDLVNIDNFRETTVKVGRFPKNASPYGVLDMGSNVREWVNDWFSKTYYRNSPEENPTGPQEGQLKVLRGAAWHDKEEDARVTRRYAHDPTSAGANRGFRCAFDDVPAGRP